MKQDNHSAKIEKKDKRIDSSLNPMNPNQMNLNGRRKTKQSSYENKHLQIYNEIRKVTELRVRASMKKHGAKYLNPS